MDQEKIGKLIARLRKSKGLTQSELGDMVGVGFRAVSKWENGLTVPDISIINDLSKLLGISADELLNGEIRNDEIVSVNNKKFNIKKLIFIIPVIVILLLSVIMINIISNRAEVYKLENDDIDYYIEGQIIFKNDKIIFNVNQLNFENSEFQKVIIKNYQYEVYANDNFLFGYGQMDNDNLISKQITIGDWCSDFKIGYEGKVVPTKHQIINNGIELIIGFVDNNNNQILKNIKIKLVR